MKWNWKRWKAGLAVAAVLGLCSGAIGLAAGATFKQALYVFGGAVATHLAAFLNEHPVSSIEDDDNNKTGNPS